MKDWLEKTVELDKVRVLTQDAEVTEATGRFEVVDFDQNEQGSTVFLTELRPVAAPDGWFPREIMMDPGDLHPIIDPIGYRDEIIAERNLELSQLQADWRREVEGLRSIIQLKETQIAALKKVART